MPQPDAPATPAVRADALTDPRRLAAVAGTGLLDAPSPPGIERLTRLVARTLRAPVALITLVDAGRVYFAGHVGLPPALEGTREVPHDHAFCHHLVPRREPLVIGDVAREPLVADHPMLHALGVRAYAGAPLVADGEVIGGVCAIDFASRAWSDDDVQTLRDVAAAAATEIALRREVAERTRSEQSLRESERRFRSLNASSPVGIFECDVQGRVVHTNRRAVEIFGLTAGEAAAEGWAARIHPDDLAELAEAWQALHARGEEFEREYRVLLPGGGERWVRGRAAPLLDADGAVVGSVSTVEDVDRRRALEAELVRRAEQDPLTRLANREVFRTRLDAALARGPRDRVAVLYLDVDEFKAVNDGLGHSAGDRLLALVAERLLSATRGVDSVARLGGDEFAVLLEHVQEARDAEVVAERVRAAMGAPFALGEREVRVSASLGIAVGGGDAEEVLRNADLAMYEAKKRGPGRHATFTADMHAALVERLALEADLRLAVDRGQIEAVFQPVVELRTGRTAGAEALARWRHPERGWVSPAVFIPLAERVGVVCALGRAMLDAACAHAAAWSDPTLGVNVNVSGHQLQDPEFPGHVRAALERTGLDPRRLVLEMTESVLIHDTEAALARLTALKELGVRLAIDDFGTGYSSLAYLHRFPIDVLKIDRTFVAGLCGTGRDAALARAILTLGEMLEVRLVAEGVEEDAQHAMLARLGCEFAQGFLFSRPLAPADFASRVAAECAARRPGAAGPAAAPPGPPTHGARLPSAA